MSFAFFVKTNNQRRWFFTKKRWDRPNTLTRFVLKFYVFTGHDMKGKSSGIDIPILDTQLCVKSPGYLLTWKNKKNLKKKHFFNKIKHGSRIQTISIQCRVFWNSLWYIFTTNVNLPKLVRQSLSFCRYGLQVCFLDIVLEFSNSIFWKFEIVWLISYNFSKKLKNIILKFNK